MGSHTNSRKLATRLLTLTLSFLTLMMFAFYTTDITAKMTSGPPGIPIRTFEDVVYQNYKVVTFADYYKDLLKNSNPGSAKHEAYNHHLQMKKDEYEAIRQKADHQSWRNTHL